MSERSILDPDAIESLRSINPGDNGEFLKELVEIFLTDTPTRIAEVRNCLASGDAKTLGRAAHSMKGSAGNFGALAFADVNRDIESHARDGNLAAIAPLLPRLDAEFERLKAALIAELK